MQNKPQLTVVKIGGNVIDNPDALKAFLADFALVEGYKILVHGGGKIATKTAEGLGITAVFHEGRRITDKPMLDVAVMTYAGLINKDITAQLQSLGNNAIGFTGADGNLILSEKRKNAAVDFGFVGDVISVADELLKVLLLQNIVPVFCAVTHDGKGQLLNTNADTIAAELAVACSAHFDVKLLYCFEKKGVLTDVENEDSVIKNLTFENYQELREQGAIHSGMLPKLENCFNALNRGVTSIGIGSPEMIKGGSDYTLITP
ncbi:acetylglutamate kinase [Flavobacterium akiainvivens]|uniref:Acetylglutamate kinase n=1 Tax=Flavobacterium akiainvivens TaxID=1202724 RepID=A0A0M8MH44_9FLAO|nr:acetylglutamate kinase [Flavobacterium akiainvivens]KOS05478.1 acetylglutamate kinase [Flavobacterium akiainvivens]SFQ32768.1 N-acetylglutamate kinase [Flavobacterium akiainvivens]